MKHLKMIYSEPNLSDQWPMTHTPTGPANMCPRQSGDSLVLHILGDVRHQLIHVR